MKYMHAIGQHERLSLANGLLLVQMFSQARRTSWEPFRGGCQVLKKEKKRIFEIRISKLTFLFDTFC